MYIDIYCVFLYFRILLQGSDFRRSGQNCLRFYYSMNGFHCGTLDVYTRTSNRFISSNESRTRGHSQKLFKQRWESAIRGNIFSCRVINSWNSLPDKCEDIKTFEINLINTGNLNLGQMTLNMIVNISICDTNRNSN